MSHKTESAFLRELEQRGSEEQKLLQTELLPSWARGLGDWLVVNPWRVLVPVAMILYVVCRLVYGEFFGQFILKLFGGFR